jgi:predicted enzyme related to lactoylglutathione lyase
MKKGRITGIGGIFFKCDDPQKMREWYRDQFGLITDDYGALFEFRLSNEPDKLGYLQWSTMSQDSKHFEPSTREFMVNYRVEDMEALVERLRADGVTILDDIETYDYGKFVHILDPEGNKVELWEPVDKVFTEYSKGNANK